MSLTNSYCYRPPKWVGTAWKKYSYRIYKLCLQKCGTKDDADDLFQEVALRFCQKADVLNNSVYVLPWLRTVLLHCHYSCYRKRHQGKEIPVSCLCESRAGYDVHDEFKHMVHDDSIKFDSIMNEFSFLLESLNPLEKMIVELSVVGGLNIRDLSRLIGLSRCNIVNQRTEAYIKMREKMMVQKEKFKIITGRDASLREIIELAG